MANIDAAFGMRPVGTLSGAGNMMTNEYFIADNEALENDLMKEQHPSMPINQERQTRVTFGGSKKD